MRPFVALCYRIAGHVKQAAKEVKGIGPGTFGCPGFFLGRAFLLVLGPPLG
jgi:hypothetical protein